MSPPIRDGSGSSIGAIRLGDGTEISEVRTGAGDVLFSGSAIPDTSMFNSAIYQFYAGSSSASYGSTADFPEVLDSSVANATAQNSPILRENYESSGYDMFDYTKSDGDYHSVTPDAEYSTDDKISVFCLVYPKDVTSNYQIVYRTADEGLLNFNDDSYSFLGVGGPTSYEGGTASANTLDTIGFTFNNGTLNVYGGGSEVISNVSSSVGSNGITGNDVEIGADSTDGYYMDGGIAEVVVCSGIESLSNYQDYHNDRVV